MAEFMSQMAEFYTVLSPLSYCAGCCMGIIKWVFHSSAANMALPYFGYLPKSVRSRRFVVLCTLSGVTLIVSAVAALSYRAARGLMLANLQQQALSEIHKGSAEIDQWLAVRKAEVQMLGSSPLVQTLDWSVVQPYLQAELRRNDEFDLFTLTPPNGWNYNTVKGWTGKNSKDRSWFTHAMAGRVTASNPIVNRSTGAVQINITAPVKTVSDRQPRGVVGGAILINHVLEILQQLQYGSHSYAWAIDSLGVPIAHPDATLIGTPERPVPSFLQSQNPQLAAIARRMVAHQEGIELIRLDDQWQYVAYGPLHEADWSIALVIPRDNIEHHLNALDSLAAVAATLLIIAILGCWRQVQSYERARTRAAQEALLNRLTARSRESLDLQTILQTTVTELASLKPLEQVFVGWYQPETQQFNVICQSSAVEAGRENLFECYPASGFTDCLARGESVQLKPIEPAERSPLTLLAGQYLALALPAAEGQLGYLLASHSQGLHRSDRELLQAVADQLAIAIRQAELYAQTQRQVKLLNATLTQLQQTQTHLVQREKMSSLGQLVAGIAHEINNPVNFIYGNLVHAEEYAQDILKLADLYQQGRFEMPLHLKSQVEAIDIEFLSEDLPKLLASMKVGASRIQEIVHSLRVFSRLDEAEVKAVDIHEGIDSTLMLLQHRLNPGEPLGQPAIQVKTYYGDLPEVECYAGQLNQVFMNILSNAIDALSDRTAQSSQADGLASPSCITIRTEVRAAHAVIRIADNGPGIPEAIQHRLFDPFFTTKPVGQGIGMGLAISYQIVTQTHQGQLRCVSAVDRGTELVIEIPICQKRKSEQTVFV